MGRDGVRQLHDVVGIDPDDFVARVGRGIDALIDANPGRRVLVVAHGGVLNVVVGRVLGIDRFLWYEPRYAGITRVLASREGVRSVASLNECAHLRGLV